MEEHREKFSEEDLEYFKPIISLYRPMGSKIEDLRKCDPSLSHVDSLILYRDIIKRYQILNEYALEKIVQEFATESDDSREYMRKMHLFKMGICLEFWKEYFHSHQLSVVNLEIRQQLKEKCIPLTVTESASYSDFKEWIHSYAPTPESKQLYLKKFHGFRMFTSGMYSVWCMARKSLPFSEKILGMYGDDGSECCETTTNANDDEEQKMLCRIFWLVERIIDSEVARIHCGFRAIDIPEIIYSYKEEEERFTFFSTARILCIAYAIWSGYKPPLTPKSLFFYIIPRLVLTREIFSDAHQMLSSLV